MASARFHGLTLCMLLALVGSGCTDRRHPPAPAAAVPPVVFEEITREAGVDFRHVNGATGRKYLPETMGAGCALLDVDNDGWLDLFLVDSTSWPSGGAGKRPGRSRLYRNLGRKGGSPRFVDVTGSWAVPADLFGMGVAAGDFDNDGFTDLFITGLNDSRLLRNAEGRRFVDVTRQWGIRTPGWPTGAAWVDFDRDGLLDLFVCHYVEWSPATDVPFSLDGVRRSYARPDRYPGEACQLFQNRGRRFQDVSATAGVDLPNAKALGVALCDFDRDGWIDLAVSNDMVPNFLFHNQGNGTFKEVATQAGMAVTEAGSARAGMGIDTAIEEDSGRLAVLITNFAGEQLSLYRQDDSGLFMDVAARSGIGTPSQRYLGFGAFFFDADLDGWQDIFVANGHIQDDIAVRSSGATYAEPALFFHGTSGGYFRDASAAAGALTTPRVARGAAAGDLDRDGDLDLLLTTNGGPAALLRQAGRPRNHWLRLRLQGAGSNRSAIGAAVRVRTGDHTQSRLVRSGSSYLSQSSLAVTFGLGGAERADDLEVRWPNGQVESYGPATADQERTLVEGKGLQRTQAPGSMGRRALGPVALAVFSIMA